MSSETILGKEHALACLETRRKENAEKTKIDNSSLRAGSPMTYYCISCDGVSEVLPENHISSPKKLCDECQALKILGWLE